MAKVVVRKQYEMFSGIGMFVKELAPKYVLDAMVAASGKSEDSLVVEFMAMRDPDATTMAMDGKPITVVEWFYRLSGSDTWFRIQIEQKEGELSAKEYVLDHLETYVTKNKIDWDKLIATAGTIK